MKDHHGAHGEGPDHIDIGLQDLILLGIDLVSESGENCTFERLVAECYWRFPGAFGFKRYPQWPDSLKLDRPLRTLREKGLIVGTVRGYLSLTPLGERTAVRVSAGLLPETSAGSHRLKEVPARSADDMLIAYLKAHQLAREFASDPAGLNSSEPAFRNLLRCTLETPLRIVKQNLEYYTNIAEEYGETALVEFLRFCEGRFLNGGERGG